MEADPNPMPKFELLPRLSRLGSCALRFFSMLPAEAPDYMSDHYRGAAALLDHELYDKTEQLQLDFEHQSETAGW